MKTNNAPAAELKAEIFSRVNFTSIPPANIKYCDGCGQNIGYNPRKSKIAKQVVCNLYEIKPVDERPTPAIDPGAPDFTRLKWVGALFMHPDCYADEGQPYGPPTSNK